MVGQLHRGVLNALNYAGVCTRAGAGAHVCLNDRGEDLRSRWEQLRVDVPVDMVTAHYRYLGTTVEDR